MKRFYLYLAFLASLLWCLSEPAVAQTKQIKNLKNEAAKIEKGIKQSKTQLEQKKKETEKKEQTAGFLEEQVRNRVQYIDRLNTEIDTLEHRVERLEGELQDLDSQLTVRKDKYVRSLRAARQSQVARNPVLFIFSGQSFPKMVRRSRYARELASLQKTLGIQLMEKQNQVRDKQNELLEAKQQMSTTVQEVIRQRQLLASRHSVVKRNVVQLQKQQKEIEQQMRDQQKKLTELNKKIDELVAYEIEQARKRAEAEAKRKREAELAAQRAREAKNKGGKGSTKPADKPASSKTPAPTKWLTAEDRQLNGSLEQNKGRLPVPITGPYRVARRFGLNQVSKGIILDNKGVNYMGQSGARARAIFDGVVSAIFQLGDMKNVLIRHGSYISVYCNLSSTIVTRGQKVKARDLIGTVAEDNDGNHILHFQLRKETAKLNPEAWIGR
ncbi:MAG: peptidoglycan DD-metalloendopeptidase family protein [Bacteroidaceae bacterium]|nr:peptidoglycan DD-metalloendopeptidase family protein [Bacteroidaceae bacterium]